MQPEDFSPEFIAGLLEKIGGNSATIVLDSGGICVFASKASENVLKINPKELLGKNFSELLTFYTLEGKQVETIKNPINKALAYKDFIQSTPFFCKLTPKEDSTLALSTIQLQDKSKISHVVVQIRTAKREVEVGEMKTLFLSFAAHQLKTPSSVVKGFLELMMRQGEAAYSNEQWHYLTSAFESNEQLIEVSKTLLNMARLDGGLIEPNIQEFDPYRAIQGKSTSFAPLYQTKRVTVNFSASEDSSGSMIRSDEGFFLEVFGILFGNAIKHSPIGGVITVSCAVTGNNCEVHVIDAGPGIALEIQKSLFKEQQQSNSQENSYGLGLFMAKKYISLLGGTIGIEPSETGSDFYFTVPSSPV